MASATGCLEVVQALLHGRACAGATDKVSSHPLTEQKGAAAL
jgi:hypothetical protein